MHHFFEAITNTAGDSLIGYFARVIDRTTQNTVTLSSDDNGTPIVTVSGVENMAKSDAYGNLSLYVVPGTYHLDIYAPNTTSFLYRVSDVAMNSTKGDPGPQGEQGNPGNGLSDTFTQPGTGAVTRTGTDKLRDTVSLRDYGADPTGVASSVTAFNRALAAGKRVIGRPGDIYLLDASVTVPDGRDIIGNKATLKTPYQGIDGCLNLVNNNCLVSDWIIDGAGGLYSVLNTGKFNEFSNNICTGNIGHYFFSTSARKVKATGNRVLGLTASTQITTALCVENSFDIDVSNNLFDDVMTGWAIQFRNCQNFGIKNNVIFQKQYSDTKTATSGQTVFNFNLVEKVLIDILNGKGKVRIQINGKPLSPKNRDGSTNYTIDGTGPTFTITFTTGRTAGELVKLVGYRGAENIQLNNGSRDGVVSLNSIDGGADAGIIVIGRNITLDGNNIKNVGYAGIAVYGGSSNVSITGGVIANVAQMDDGQSSPDDPTLSSPFAGGIFNAGENVTVNGVVIDNSDGTMQYAAFSNYFNTMRTDGSYGLRYTGLTYAGLPFSVAPIVMPNQTPGQRMNSISVDGPIVSYPEQINLEDTWVDRSPPVSGTVYLQPADTTYFIVGGSSQTRAVKDTTVTKGGGASIQTVAGEYLDFNLTRAAMLRDTVVEVTFWAKNAGGNSYVHVITTLAGGEAALIAPITSTSWRQYTISFPFTNDLTDAIKIRVGANIGSANVQYIQINARRL